MSLPGRCVRRACSNSMRSTMQLLGSEPCLLPPPAHPCSSARTSERRDAYARHVAVSSAWAALGGTQPTARAMLDGLFSLAAAMPAPGWTAAVALLRHCG